MSEDANKRELSRLKDQVSADEQLRVQQERAAEANTITAKKPQFSPPAEMQQAAVRTPETITPARESKSVAPPVPPPMAPRPKFSEPADVQQAKMQTPTSIESRTTSPAPKVAPPARVEPMVNAQFIPPKSPRPMGNAPMEDDLGQAADRRPMEQDKDARLSIEDRFRNLQAYCEMLEGRFAELNELYAPLTDELYADGEPQEDIFSGTAYFEGEAMTEDLITYPDRPWVKLVISTKTFSEEATAPSDPWPADEHWWSKGQTKGDIHYWFGSEWKMPFKFVFMFTGTTASIADIPAKYGTFALCDGTANSVGNGGSGANLSGRFIVGVGQDDSGDSDRQTYALGDNDGEQFHGDDNGTVGNVNNHADHDVAHRHTVNPSLIPDIWTEEVATGTKVWGWSDTAMTSMGLCWGTTSDPNWIGGGVVPVDGLLDHSMTDNRPPFYALCFIERIS